MSKSPKNNIRLGEFLIATGMISEQQLMETITMAAGTGLPLGRALILSNLIDAKDLEAALKLQMILRNSSIPLKVALDAYRYASQDGVTAEQGLAKAGFTGQVISYSKLGTLLVDAKLISKEQFEEAQKTSYDTGLPLGRMLCLTGAISEQTLAVALEAQRRLRDLEITKDQALERLSKLGPPVQKVGSAAQPSPAVRTQATLKEMPKEESQALRKVKLGELLLMSGVITELDVMNALEVSLSSDKSMGEVLVETKVVPRTLIEVAVELQGAINEGTLSIVSASESLNYIARTGERPQILTDTQSKPTENIIKLGELLEMSDHVQSQDIEFASELVKMFPSLIGKLLVVAGSIDEPTLLAALRCQFLLRRKEISVEQGIQALKQVGQKRQSFDDALDELGYANSSAARPNA